MYHGDETGSDFGKWIWGGAGSFLSCLFQLSAALVEPCPFERQISSRNQEPKAETQRDHSSATRATEPKLEGRNERNDIHMYSTVVIMCMQSTRVDLCFDSERNASYCSVTAADHSPAQWVGAGRLESWKMCPKTCGKALEYCTVGETRTRAGTVRCFKRFQCGAFDGGLHIPFK